MGTSDEAGARTPAPVDYTPLGRTPTVEEVERLREELARGDHGKLARTTSSPARMGAFIGGLVGGLLVFVSGMVVLTDSSDRGVGLVAVAVSAGIGLVVGLLVAAATHRSWLTTVRLATFARANGFGFHPEARAPRLPSVLRSGANANTSNRVSWETGGCPAQMGTYHRASGGTTSNSTSSRYLAVRLGLGLPAMTFLCGRRGPLRGELRRGPDAFEGRRYSLRMAGWRTDERATVLFDERVVSLLTDPAISCNAEYVDGWFLVYYPHRRRDDETLWRHALGLADAVVAAGANLVPDPGTKPGVGHPDG
ncbi:hypothetical protein [Nocardioides pantholopis]|uniref:hypothetical protein n=1 Tax=Nocardioides pantholopis TaxID=2483798 RepID=UPI0013E2ECF8|nr:hypothetical protein [Nocardioides pantholopis]